MERVLVEQGTRLAQLVEQLLDLFSARTRTPSPSSRSGSRCAHASRSGCDGRPDRAGDVRVDVAPGLEADADPTAFDRIVSNLVVNARPVRTAAALVVRAHRAGRSPSRRWSRTAGEGVPLGVRPCSSSSASRVAGRARAREIGTGLGLAIARSFARAHHGELTYEAAHPTGARFELLLPVRAPAGGGRRRAPASPGRLGLRTVDGPSVPLCGWPEGVR
jgi:signal transduction histidine kinase